MKMQTEIKTSQEQKLPDDRRFLIICERDVGLFSLIQQVIANIPRALVEERVPIV